MRRTTGTGNERGGALSVVTVTLVAVACAVVTPAAQYQGKTLIAHRGASAYAPEHTLAAYRLALAQGADFVEVDLGITRDGVLVCLHDGSLERTTDVEAVYPDRFTVEAGRDGQTVRRWPVDTFTLAEIRALDAGSWFAPEFAGARIPTFQEAIDLIKGRAGLFPELKSPARYRARSDSRAGQRDESMETLVVAALAANGLTAPAASGLTPVILQSFDETSLRRLARLLPQVPRIFLLGAGARVSTARLRSIAAFANGIGPAKRLLTSQPDVVGRAHAHGLSVTPYTFRAGSSATLTTVEAEMAYFLYALGVDALFTDNPDRFPGRRARREGALGARH